MKVFILEDDPNRMSLFYEVLGFGPVTHCDNSEEAKEAYDKHKPFDLVLLDHDLCDDRYTGYHFAKWLAETQQPSDKIHYVVHSYNPSGAERIDALLTRAGWIGWREPFGTRLLNRLHNLTVGPTGALRFPEAYLPLPRRAADTSDTPSEAERPVIGESS